MTLEEIEKENTFQDGRLGPDPVLFGFSNKEWLKFKTKIFPGDELWFVSSNTQSWQFLAGRSGYAIVKDGDIVDFFMTCMS